VTAQDWLLPLAPAVLTQKVSRIGVIEKQEGREVTLDYFSLLSWKTKKDNIYTNRKLNIS